MRSISSSRSIAATAPIMVRIDLVAQLVTASRKELRTRDLAPALGITEATVSHHLMQLLQARLVTNRRDGANV